MGWAGFPDLFNDAAYYQGDYWSPPESSGVIVNTARCNQGAYSETTWGAKQLANVRAQGKDTGHYLFNGNLERYTVGRLWAATCRRNGFNPATEVLGYDCEDEGATGTHAWGPGDVAECQRGFNDAWGSPIPWKSIRVYMNRDVNRRFNWSALVAAGAQLWYARPGGSLDQAWWPTVWAKQDGLYQGVDANGYAKTFAASNGAAPAAPTAHRRRRAMSLYVFQHNGWTSLFDKKPDGTFDHVAVLGGGDGEQVAAGTEPLIPFVRINYPDGWKKFVSKVNGDTSFIPA